MARYEPSGESFLIVGRGADEELLLEDEDGNVWAANPGKRQRKKKFERIETPLGEFDDLRIRVGLIRKKSVYPKVVIDQSSSAFTLVRTLSNEPQETMNVILLDSQNRVIGIHQAHRGGVAAAAIDPQVIFQAAIIANATSIVLAHNHPSGSPKHSAEDTALTRAIEKAGNTLGIRLLDHLVVGTDSYESYADMGLL